ncbi:MAG: DNA polymerase IV [Calditrichaeota bacterium]|nr:DNA polymerase IV [Calditrichota bacterium]
MAPLIFHIDVDAFFASAEQSFNPLLRGKPVIVGGLPDQRGVVHSASYEAREKGVRKGMPLSEAKKRCPHAIFLKGDFRHYHDVARRLLHIYRDYTPAVEFSSLDDAYLDVSGMCRLWKNPVALAQTIQKSVWERLHIPVSIGIGSSKLISRIASGQRKPRGLTYVPEGRELEFLFPLPVHELPGVGPATQRLLYDLGILTVGELAQMSRNLLFQMFGKRGLTLWEFANAKDHRTVRAVRLPKNLSRETSFGEDVSDPAVVLATIHYLIERLAKKLRENHLTCRKLSLAIRYSDFRTLKKSVTLPESTQDGFQLEKMAQHVFETLHLRRTRIRFVGVQLSGLEWDAAQPRLFQFQEKEKSLNRTIDHIRRRFGFAAILPAKTLLLQSNYEMDGHGYILHTPSLSQ